MKAKRIQCADCGAIIDISNAVGQWIECPNCGARYLIDNDIVDQLSVGRADVNAVGDVKEHNLLYFLPQCSYSAFRSQCFDMMMHHSPADIFSQMTIQKEIQSYLPYVASIGGESDSYYNAVYVGANMPDAILKEYAGLSFKNSDKNFGAFKRSHTMGNQEMMTVHVEKSRMTALPAWAANADELHYYPFYCMVCCYQGKYFMFTSLGNSDIQTTNMPVDEALHRKPRLINLTKEELSSRAKGWARVAMAILAICLLIIFWNDITGDIAERRAFFSEHWPIMQQRSGWFAYVLITIRLMWWGIKAIGLFFIGFGIAFYSLYCLSWLILVISIKLKNRSTMHRCLDWLKSIQAGKQQAAYARFSVSLNKLYDKEGDLKP